MPTLRHSTAVRPLCQRCNKREVDVDDDWVSTFCAFCNDNEAPIRLSPFAGAPPIQAALTTPLTAKSTQHTCGYAQGAPTRLPLTTQ